MIFVQLVEKSSMHEQDSTRKHFSKMRAARLPTVRVGGHPKSHVGGGGVSIPGPMSGGVPYIVTYPMMHVMLPLPQLWTDTRL